MLKKIKSKQWLHLLKDPCIWLIILGLFGLKYIILSSIITIAVTIFTFVALVIALAGMSATVDARADRYGGGSYGAFRVFQELHNDRRR